MSADTIPRAFARLTLARAEMAVALDVLRAHLVELRALLPPADGQTHAMTEAASDALRARAQARMVEHIQKTGGAQAFVVDLD
jgi:hypothetical protein